MVQPEVKIEQGELRGSTGTDIQGKTFFKFQGIPYAKAPLGTLRFKAPLPPEKWTGIFDATKEGDCCYSRAPFKNATASGSENCLFLNVFTKKLPDGKNTDLRPVLFWIHGGAFVWGCGNESLYGPRFLMTEDVVLVTINYRLGLLGFLSFDDPTLDIPGNAGFKDQVQALKWVKKNIPKFGGDPNNVTIFGGSAGGVCVHLLMLSPLGKGLFHKAIAQSGCALNPFGKGARSSQLLATVLKLERTDDKTIYNFLMEKSVEEILEIQEKMDDKVVASELRKFGLVIENSSKEPFLSEEPLEIMKSGNFNRVPFILGYATVEGMCFEIEHKPGLPDIAPSEDMVPYSFGYHFGSAEAKAVAEKIKKFYFGDDQYSQSVSKKYDMVGDCHFLHGIYLTVIHHWSVSKTPIYLYRMSLETKLNFLKMILKTQTPGASHYDDVGYLFNNYATPKINSGSVEDISIRRFVKLWTNFAKFANPTFEGNELLKTLWKPVTGSNLDFLDIGIDLVPKSNPEPERMRFWTKLYAESPAGLRIEPPYLRSSL